ncbi:hypothetical protein [Spartinivicinus ruber]|uniref:hypothetical protein n=1 Tax=Spartinivicinus ruber TaxID=2683272 RepID=UPI0013D158FE|nr:hypothetical protein [Spartinivicinus ruber]
MKTSYKIIVGSILSIFVYLAIFQPRFYLYTYEYFFKDYYTIFFENDGDVVEFKITKKYLDNYIMRGEYFKSVDYISINVPYEKYGIDENVNGGNWSINIKKMTILGFSNIKKFNLSDNYFTKFMKEGGYYSYLPCDYKSECFIECPNSPLCRVWYYSGNKFAVNFLIDKNKISELNFYLKKSEQVIESLRMN